MNTRSLLFCGRLLCAAGFSSHAVADVRRVRMADSVLAPDTSPAARAQVVRRVLTDAEQAQPMTVLVSLRMRNFDELQARLGRGEQIAQREMEARYLPLASDYEQVRGWLASQGFEMTRVDANHTNVFVRAPVARIASALEISFARVGTVTGEFTSAVTAPALPAEFATTVLGVVGLQPEQQLRPPAETRAASSFVHPTRAIPADILGAYHAPASVDGTGQVIAVVAGDIPLASDLALFYQTIGLTQIPPDLVVKRLNGGPAQTDLSNEATMDVEWASAIAPGAQVVLYAPPSYGIVDLLAACTQILNDGQAKIVSHSASGLESGFSPAILQSGSQTFAQLAAAGVTVLHGSGDSGTTGVPVYPSSDPFVTSLGGTTLTFDANWNVASEVVWPQTGGGTSTVFARPAWQTGPGVPVGTMRLVPDAASVSSAVSASGTMFPLTIRDGKSIGVGGDSLCGPVWAGLVARINQARANAGLPPIGLLAPRLYALLGTDAVNDIVSGNNGADTAGPGYDRCSGVGSPNLTALIRALTTSDPPSIRTQPKAQVVADGSTAAFRVETTGIPAPTYQWLRDGAPVPGATTAMLVVHASQTTVGAYACVATNATGTVSTQPAALTLAAPGNGGRILNLSILTDISATVRDFTVGTFIAGGDSNASKPLLVRGVGPSLAIFGVTTPLADPELEVYSGSTLLASDDDWGGSASLAARFVQTGAFDLIGPASKDAALYLPSLVPGNYSVRIGSANAGTGTAIAELYDASTEPVAANAPRLVNVSVLKRIGGSETFTTGFVVGGNAAETVLIRAIGPRLGLAPFNIAGVMPDPEMTLFDAKSVRLAQNDNWGGDSQITQIGDQVGAFGVADGDSKDAMLLVTLAPGNYSVQVTDGSQTGGIAIIEVYEVR